MTLRSPLSRALGLGTARSGSQTWWAERVSAVALIPLSLWFAAAVLSLDHVDYAHVRALFVRPSSALFAILFMAAMAYHSYLGTAVIVEDYVHSHARKLALLLVLRCVHWLAAAAAIFALLQISFGAARL